MDPSDNLITQYVPVCVEIPYSKARALMRLSLVPKFLPSAAYLRLIYADVDLNSCRCLAQSPSNTNLDNATQALLLAPGASASAGGSAASQRTSDDVEVKTEGAKTVCSLVSRRFRFQPLMKCN